METGDYSSKYNNQLTTLPDHDKIDELKELEWLNVRIGTGDWTLVITR